MSRFRASLIHLLISAVLVSAVIGLVWFVWYPEPTFEAVGAFSIIRLLVGVDLVIGPLLTLVVFKQGKPGLKFDLTAIAVMQIVALIYGSHRLYVEKPDFMVFAVDRLEFVAAKRVDQSAIQFDELRTREFGDLVQVFARQPEDPDEYQKYLDSIMFEGKPDLESRPEFWEPWDSGADVIRDQIKSIEDIQTTSATEKENVQQAIDEHAALHPNLGVLPIGGIEKDIGMLIDLDTLEILGVLDANPWLTSES